MNNKTQEPNQEPRKPSETNKTLLLIATSTPALAMMYMQDVNVWVVFMLFVITISQAFNLASMRMHSDTINMLSDKTHQVINNINKIIQDYNGMYQNQVILKDKIDVLNTANEALYKSNEALIAAAELMHEDMKELETKFEMLASRIIT